MIDQVSEDGGNKGRIIELLSKKTAKADVQGVMSTIKTPVWEEWKLCVWMLCLHRHFAQLGWPVASAATLTAFRLSQQEKTAAGNFL